MALFLSCFFWLPTKKTLNFLPIRSTLPWKLSAGIRHLSSKVGEELSTTAEKCVSCLETCTGNESLRKLHTCILTHGLGDNILLEPKLLNCYDSLDGLTESRWVFDKIINQNLSDWNSSIVGCFRTGHFGEVLRLYLNLKLWGPGIDSPAVTFCLKSCTELGAIEFGRGIHGNALKVSLNRGKFVGSSLVGLYSKCGSIDDAHRVFEEILDRDVVVYTAMVTGYAQLTECYGRKAFAVVRFMQREGVDPNRVTLVSLLQAAGQLKALEEGQSVHCYAIRRGIDLFDEVLETSLMDMYIKCGARNVAASIFRKMERRTIASWNAMIAGLVHCGQPSEALDLFYFINQEKNLSPDSITLANLLLACTDLRCARLGSSIHGYIIRREVPLDLVSATSLIDMYSKCHMITKARKLFDRLFTRDVVCYNVMIAGYLQSDLIDETIEMFYGMVKEGIRPNSATLLSLLSAFADVTDIRRGRWIHGYAVRYRLQSDVGVSNQILHMYAKCGRVDLAREIFNRITNKDLVSWTAMMMGYVCHGHADEALSLFWLMQRAGEKPDSFILVNLLQALSQLGCLKKAMEIHGYIYRIWLDRDIAAFNSLTMVYAKCGRLDIAEAVFTNMEERELASWNTMIAVYGMHGSCRKALELFHQMQRENVKPDEVTFTSILSSCSHAGLVEDGWHIFHSIAEYSIAPQEEHYTCMIDLLGRAGRLEEAFDFIKCFQLRDSTTSALSSLLSACRTHTNTELGEVIARQLLYLEPETTGAYTLVSNIYAEAGRWTEAARLRVMARERGLTKMPGYSLIDLDRQVVGYEAHEN